MSFASSFARPAMGAARLLRGNLSTMAKGLGVIIGGGLMGAIYHSAHDEIKTSIDNWRTRREYVARRHEALLIRLLGGELDSKLQEKLLHSKNAFGECVRMLADPKVDQSDKDIIRDVFHRATSDE